MHRRAATARFTTFEARLIVQADSLMEAEQAAVAVAAIVDARVAEVRPGRQEPFSNISGMDGSVACHECTGRGWFQDRVEEEHDAGCSGRCERSPCESHGYR